MVTILLVIAMLATVATALWLAFEGNAVMALPLAIVFAGLLRAVVRRSRRRGITPGEIAPRGPEDRAG
jgi:membrane protein implicated in regulation of membrane protease activity